MLLLVTVNFCQVKFQNVGFLYRLLPVDCFYFLLEDLKHSYTFQLCNILKYYENVSVEDLLCSLPCAGFLALKDGQGIQKKHASDGDHGLPFLLSEAPSVNMLAGQRTQHTFPADLYENSHLLSITILLY